MTDKDRINWLELKDGFALVSDDFGRWAVTGDGMQNVPDNIDEPSDISTSFFIEAHQWRGSIRQAIDAAIETESAQL